MLVYHLTVSLSRRSVKTFRGDKMEVSKKAIVEASVKILNRDGIERLSMRAIAKELNIGVAVLAFQREA